jgi:hypothetical protein
MTMVRPLGILLGAALFSLPGQAGAAEPRSAIPWLSQSLQELPAAERPEARPALPPRPAGDDTIAVTPLPAISLDAVGILPPEETGFARDLWGTTSALRVRTLIAGHRDAGVPEARALFRRLLLAEADPPPGAGASAQVLVARIDRLLEAGALEEADALVARAGAETPDLFRRMFDIGLLLDRAEPACEALRRNPSLSPTLPARIFCLARDGDWNAAEITLTLGRNVGALTSAEELALARFLDPELFEHLPPPPPPDPFTPLDFLLREAVGLPRPPGPLPLAFAHRDLHDYMPMRVRILAGERLVLEGAIPEDLLFDAYRAGRPAASGGIWERAGAVLALDEALAEDDPERLATALLEADAAFAGRGLRLAFARAYAAQLAALDPDALAGEALQRLFELLLLAGETEAARAAAPDDGARTLLLLTLASGETLPRRVRAKLGDIEAAALASVGGRAEADGPAARLLLLLAEGRQGEALLGALDLLADGPRTGPAELEAALVVLRAAGQEAAARRIALETLLLAEPDAS